MPGSARVQILATAKDGFMSGMHLAALAAAAIVLLAAAGVFLWLPSKAPTEEEARCSARRLDPVDEPEPVAVGQGSA